jgi:hypothetical protein
MSVHTLNGQFDFIIQRPQHESKPQCLVRLGLFPGTPVHPEHAFANQVMADQTMFCLEASVNATDYWKVRQEMSCSMGPFSCPRNTIQEAWRHWRLATRKVEALVPITESSGALHGPFHTSLTVYLCYLCSSFTAHALSHCPFTACLLPIHCHELPIHVLCRTKQSHEHRRLTVPDMSQATKGHWHRGGCVLWRVEGGPSGRRPPRSGDIPDRSPGPRGRKSGPSHPRNALTTASTSSSSYHSTP